MVTCTRCPVELVPMVWGAVAHWVQEAVENGDGWWTEAELLRRCKLGQMGLWLFSDESPCGVVITEVEDWGEKRVATIAVCGGRDLVKWFDYISEIESWARSFGASEIQVRGRLGWQKLLRKSGYNAKVITLAKAL